MRDFGTGEQEDVPVTADLKDSTLAFDLPPQALDDLGDAWVWSATLHVDGVDADFCPDP